MLIKVENGTTTKYSVRQLKADNPNVSFPADISDETLASYNCYNAVETERPEASVTQTYTEGFIQQDGVWHQIWAASARPNDEAVALCKIKLTGQVQQRMDDFAKTRDYYDMASAVSYANSNNANYVVEASRCLDLRDDTWAAFYTIMDAVEAGSRSIPGDISDIEDELPALTWS